MKTILAIDPGPKESGYVEWIGDDIKQFGKVANSTLLQLLEIGCPTSEYVLVVEQVKNYGMAVGDSVLDTVFWSGRFVQAFGGEFERVPRMDVKMHLCHTSRAKDSNIRQALIDRFEPDLPPRCRPKGILKGITKDCWAALALAVYYYDTQTKGADDG